MHASSIANNLLAISTLFLLAACGSKEGRIESGLKKGSDYVRSTDWDKASVEVRNVLQIDPKNARAYFIAGQVSEAQRDMQRAYGNYLKAVELQPDLLDAKLGLARLYLFTGDDKNARSAINDILALQDKHLGARTLQAALLAREGKSSEAMAQAKALMQEQKNPPVETSMLVAGLYANQNQRTAALEVIENALKAEPKHLGLLQVAAQITGNAGKEEALGKQATGFYERAVAVAPKNNELWLQWAALHRQRGEADRAEEVLRKAIRAEPDDAQRTLALLSFVSEQRGTQAAETEFKTAITNKPRDMALRFGLVQLYRSNDRHGDAQRVLKEIVDLNSDAPSSLSAKGQLAGYLMDEGKVAQAQTMVADIIKASPRDNTALQLRSRMNLAEGKARDAIIDLRALVRDQPGSVLPVQLLAQAHRMAQEPQLAREVLADAVKFKPEDPELRLLLAADLADSKDYPRATTELDAGIRAAPQATRLYEMKARLAAVQKDNVGAVKVFEQLKVQRPKEAVAYVRLGQLYTEQKRFDAALKEYDAGLAAAPTDPTPYVAGVGLLVGLKKFDQALARLEAGLKAEPKNVLHQQLKGDVLMAQRNFAGAELAYRAAITIAPGAAVGYLNTAKAVAARGDLVGSQAVLEQGEKSVPNDLALPMARAEALTQAQRFDDAIALYDGLHQRFPADKSIINNLAYLLAEVKGDQTSAERALALAAPLAVSSNPGYLDSLGWIHYRLGQYDKALPLLEKAVALAPPSPLLQMHLGKTLVKTGNTSRGKELLQRAIDSKAPLPRLEEARAMLAQG
jgi:cellulose synthase operon protein C